jgi:demethoxyubiquinone hydroxylase (CLK1/Coq7/Cat5 family)
MPQLRVIAAGEASRADLIIVSVHHAPKLPDEITHWIEQWLPQKRHQPVVLLALFDPVYQGDSASMRTYLAQVAKKAAMQFLVHTEEEIEDL